MAEPFDDEIQFDDDPGFGDDPEHDAVRDMELINQDLPQDDAGERVSPEELAQMRQAQAIVQQFNSNPHQALQQVAQQLGFEVRPTSGGGREGVSQQPQTQGVSSEDEIANLIEDDSLKFLAPMIARVAEKIAEKRIQSEVEPLKRSQQEINQRNRQQEYVTAAQELAKRHPNWQQRENDMQERLEWVKSALSGGPLMHHKYGNLLEVMYNLASGRDNAVREVAARYREAPHQRAVSSSGNDSHQPDILQVIAKAPRKDHAKLAFDAAVKEVFG